MESIDALQGFADIDFESEQKEMGRLQQQRHELEQSSEQHQTLQKQFEKIKGLLINIGIERDQVMKQFGSWKAQDDHWRPILEALDRRIEAESPPAMEPLDVAFFEYEGEGVITHQNVGEVRERVGRSIVGRISNLTRDINKAQTEMIAPMESFRHKYPEDAGDLLAKSEYAQEFVRIHQRLVDEDLPRHEERFRDFLNTNLTESIGGLEDKLNSEVKAHRARIDQVNVALAGLEYSPGTYVEIDRRDTRDVTIRDFKARLRDCLAAGLQPSEDERLALYKKIREIVIRFGKEPEWTAKVTDTRLWLDFGVRERRRVDEEEVNYYGSSTGKSGGQKAKLAFTILSASLLAQYGLADHPHRDDSLRLVVVDEVFARTDEANSRRALELFKKMGFQLLLAAPWKAEARIAERYADSFHLTIINAEENASRVHRATRTEYEAKRNGSHGQS